MSDTADYPTDLIDVSDLSLADLETLPDSALSAALREVLSGGATVTSAGFSSRLGRGVNDLPSV
jgi:FXSXX-COOH protein